MWKMVQASRTIEWAFAQFFPAAENYTNVIMWLLITNTNNAFTFGKTHNFHYWNIRQHHYSLLNTHFHYNFHQHSPKTLQAKLLFVRRQPSYQLANLPETEESAKKSQSQPFSKQVSLHKFDSYTKQIIYSVIKAIKIIILRSAENSDETDLSHPPAEEFALRQANR